MALVAFFNSYMLNSVFSKYMPKEQKPADMELKPLFAEEEERERQEKEQTQREEV